MVSLRTFCSHHLFSFLQHQNTSKFQRNPLHISPIFYSTFSNVQECSSNITSLLASSFFQRPLSTSAQLVSANVVEEQTETNSTHSENHESTKKLKKKKKNCKDIEELGEKLGSLKREVKDLKGNGKGTEKKETSKSEDGTPTVQSKTNSLYSLFAKKPNKDETPTVQSKTNSLYSLFARKPNSSKPVAVKNSYENEKKTSKSERTPKPNRLNPLFGKNSVKNKKYAAIDQNRVSIQDRHIGKVLSPEMVSLVNQWYKEGYLKNANFLLLKKLDLSCLLNHYSLEFLKFTAERFGKDHQEIAKWLSGEDLKRVAIFGCPSFERKTVFAAKSLRSFFSIQEDSVCQSCKLKSSCKFVNQNVGKKVDNLNLANVMRILTLYELNLVDTQLVVPDEVKTSINKLLKEVIKLSQ